MPREETNKVVNSLASQPFPSQPSCQIL